MSPALGLTLLLLGVSGGGGQAASSQAADGYSGSIVLTWLFHPSGVAEKTVVKLDGSSTIAREADQWYYEQSYDWSGSYSIHTGSCAEGQKIDGDAQGSGGPTAFVQIGGGSNELEPWGQYSLGVFDDGGQTAYQVTETTTAYNMETCAVQSVENFTWTNYAVSPRVGAVKQLFVLAGGESTDVFPTSICGSDDGARFGLSDENNTVRLVWHLTTLPDQDHDGIPESGELPADPRQPCLPTSHDNCPRDFNPDQRDADGDGSGDVCDVLQPPVIDAGPPAITDQTTATFMFHGEVGATFECALSAPDAQSQEYTPCTSGQTYTDLVPGLYLFFVRAVSGSDVSEPTTYEWQITGAPPPPPPPPPDDCLDATSSFFWTAGRFGISTLRFKVDVPWCYDPLGETPPSLPGGQPSVKVAQEIGPFFVPDWVFPIYFKARDDLVFVDPPKTFGLALELRVQGSFESCSSLTEIVSLFPPLRPLLKGGFYKLPTQARRAVLDPLERLFYAAIRASAQLTIEDELARAVFMKEVESLVGNIFDELITASAPAVFEVCGETWTPDARLTLFSPINRTVTMLGYASAFWLIERVGA